jgi:hypothetical protein
MSITLLLLLFLVGVMLVSLALAFLWLLSRGGGPRQPSRPTADVENQGYGRERWERELALWRGTLRRLEIQARHQEPVSSGLQRQMNEARARIEEAERRLS